MPGPGFADFERGCALQQQGRLAEALSALDRSTALEPGNGDAHNRRGLVLSALGRGDEAEGAYRRGIEHQGNHPGLHHNLALWLFTRGRLAEAAASFTAAVQHKNDHVLAWHSLGYVQRELKQLDAALASFERAWALAPGQPYLLGDLLHLRMRLCDWRHFDSDVAALRRRAAGGEPASAPFPLLAALDDPPLQRQVAERACALLYPPQPQPAFAPEPSIGRLRVGYFSADFREHPVARLAADLIAAHDRAQVETFAFSFGPDSADALRQRIASSCDHFIDVRERSDAQIAAAARSAGLHVAIDLNGHTAGCRPGIFAHRAAPVQAAYLGYLGTMGAPYIDYLLAERELVPDRERQSCTEAIVYLPHYQAGDSSRCLPHPLPTRADFGLPEAGFVFGAFNNAWKITPTMFDAWLRILAAVPESVLLLYAENRWQQDQLSVRARSRGLAHGRLLFGERLPSAHYLARLRACDLLLDTAPYNGGTTTADALWAGVPVLTLAGAAMASRMGASLLLGAGLPELVADTLGGYEHQAISLARDPAALASLRARVERQREGGATATTTLARALEAAYRRMFDRRRQGLPAADIDLR